jgi:CRP-like cAMP-binding protein
MITTEGNKTSPSLADAVASHNFVADLPREHLATMLEVAMFKQFEAKELIFKEGEPANRFYLICLGKVAVETMARVGSPTVIQTIGANEVLGWSWLFPPYRWHFSARAMEPTDAVFFYGTRLRQRCEDDPAFGYEIMKRVSGILIHRLQHTRSQMLRAL